MLDFPFDSHGGFFIYFLWYVVCIPYHILLLLLLKEKENACDILSHKGHF